MIINISEYDRKQIVELWEIGLSIERIIRTLPYPYRVAEAKIKELRKDGTLQDRDKRKILTGKLVNAWESGIKNKYELAEMFEVSPNTVKIYLHDAGVKKGRPPKNYKKMKCSERTTDIIKDIKSGELTSVEIAKKYAVSRQYIHSMKNKVMKERNNEE